MRPSLLLWWHSPVHLCAAHSHSLWFMYWLFPTVRSEMTARSEGGYLALAKPRYVPCRNFPLPLTPEDFKFYCLKVEQTHVGGYSD